MRGGLGHQQSSTGRDRVLLETTAGRRLRSTCVDVSLIKHDIHTRIHHALNNSSSA